MRHLLGLPRQQHPRIAGAGAEVKAAPPVGCHGRDRHPRVAVGAHEAAPQPATFRSNPLACVDFTGYRPTVNVARQRRGGGGLRHPRPHRQLCRLHLGDHRGSCSATYCHGNFKNGGVTTPATPAPTAAPTGLAISTVTSVLMPVSWSAVSGATGYKVKRSTGTTSTFTQVRQPPAPPSAAPA